MNQRDIIVIGGSAGATPVIRRMLDELPKDFPASLFVVTHIQKRGPYGLRDVLVERSKLPIDVADDGQPIEPRRVYLPPADRHLLVERGAIRLGTGPKENLMRPAIDPLFRSAALAYGARTVGLVLSGYMDDGAAGLAAIKARGGTALAQDPLNAEAAAMPQAALMATEIDDLLRDEDIAARLDQIARSPASDVRLPRDPAMELEVRIAAGARLGSEILGKIAAPSTFTCPTCHGVLSELKSGPLRYRCQTGHAFSADTALEAQQADIDEALMVALRVIEERIALTNRMVIEARQRGRASIAGHYESRIGEYERYADTLRDAVRRTLMDSPA